MKTSLWTPESLLGPGTVLNGCVCPGLGFASKQSSGERKGEMDIRGVCEGKLAMRQ